MVTTKNSRKKAALKTPEVTTSTHTQKQLFRPNNNRMLGGVCAGIAKFLDFDPTVIRLIFVIVTLLGGSGILIYLILWLIIPSEDKPNNITEETLRSGADEMREKAQQFAQEAKVYSKKGNPRQTLGIILIVLGAFFLINNFAFFRFDYLVKFWPLILIVFAIYLIGKND